MTYRHLQYITFLSLLLLCIGSSSEIFAQGKNKKKKKKSSQVATSNNTSKAPEGYLKASISRKGKQEIYYPESTIKNSYNVSIIVPLYLDELVRGQSVTFKDKVPDKAAPGLAFYKGVKLAADSLERAGINMEVFVHDAGSFSQSPEMLINYRKFDTTDLIIGAVEQHDVPVLANFARKKRINFVSALTNYDGWVKDNQYFTMLQPSIKSHCEYIIDDLSEKYAGQNVTLLYRTISLADDNAAVYILNDLYSDVTFKKMLCNELPEKETLATMFDTTKPNIVVVSILNSVYADSILKLLTKYFPSTHFEVYGMPTWNEIKGLRKPNAYRNLTINVTYPFNFETTDSTLYQRIQQEYNKEFGGYVPEMALRGYEAMLWYGYLLKNYGTIFNNDYKDHTGAPFTKFRIKPRWDRNGSLLYLENKHIYLSTYQGGIYTTK